MTKDNTPIPICAASLKYIASYASVMQYEDNDVAWWQTQINTYLQQAASNPSESVRTAACDCFASLSTEIFEKFHFQYQRLAVTLLLSLAQDTKMHVKAAACRALGVFVLFPSLREDPLFMSDMIKAILLHKEDKTILVRVRISWSIANLCDALVLESVHPDFELREYMDTPEWIDILNISIAALDHEKLKSNAVRAIGSLLRLTPQPYYANTRIMALVKQAVHGLIKHIESGLLKTRWNACHATSNMLSNPFFPIGYIEGGGLYPWTHTLYTALMHALVACKNFKVRINACRALTAPEKQIQYGDKLDVIIQSMIEAWDICQQHTDCKEMKYKQQLEQQASKLILELR
ncbi:armadillo-type protein [Gilbertella persicaria]|uniref:armadillo-type protein n=1 Tax=Gilbertella persicaria TaxID=101096 RepID=UPI0022211728|nr:armadillo-type protein [Gilbertella persicaria]KAI8082570.1 armadillo-type protein [Gilbertella persicaria]